LFAFALAHKRSGGAVRVVADKRVSPARDGRAVAR
jgi:hypothetical protein